MKVKSALESRITIKKGEEYIKGEKILIDMDPETFYLHFDGLFGGDSRLG
jgi:hypothetical protein